MPGVEGRPENKEKVFLTCSAQNLGPWSLVSGDSPALGEGCMGSPVDVTSPRHIPGHLLDVPEVLTMDFTAYLVPGRGKQFQSHCPRLL